MAFISKITHNSVYVTSDKTRTDPKRYIDVETLHKCGNVTLMLITFILYFS